MTETLSDVVDDILNRIGVFGSHEDEEGIPCRSCEHSYLISRIRKAIEAEKLTQKDNSSENKYEALVNKYKHIFEMDDELLITLDKIHQSSQDLDKRILDRLDEFNNKSKEYYSRLEKKRNKSLLIYISVMSGIIAGLGILRYFFHLL